MSAHTKGVFHASDWGYVIQAGTAVRVAASLREGIEGNANADLIAEAFNVATETGLTPRQLAEQRAELLEALQAMIEWDDRENDHAVDFYERMDLCAIAFDKARAAIAKATGATP